MFPRRFLLAAVAAAGLAALRAQTPTGNIEGVVTDPSGALVPAAAVAVVETATGRKIPLATNGEGRYAARNLLPGQYNILVEASGFAAKNVRQINVSAGSVVTVDVALELTAQGEAVSVTAGQFTVDTARQTLDSVITAGDIVKLPLFGRNFLDLAALAPGVMVRNGTALDPTKAEAYRGVSVAARSGKATRVQMDGIDITDEIGGSTAANYSSESVSEFQVSRSSLDPSTSMTSSGAVNIIGRSGGNALRGSTFWDYYNQDMGARLEYRSAAVPFHRQRVGVAAGGPLIENKLFWFLDWERHYQQEQSVSQVPDFPQLNLTQQLPIGLRFGDGRLDWNVTSALRAFYRFHHDWNLATSGSPAVPYQLVNWTNTSTVGVDFGSARMTHSYRFGYVNFNDHVQSNDLDYKFPRGPGGTPYHLTVGTYDAGPYVAAPQTTYQDNWQNSYEGTLLAGRHTVRFGFDVRHIVHGVSAGNYPIAVTGLRNNGTIAQIAARSGNVQDPLEYPLQNFSVFGPEGYLWLAPAHGMPHGGIYNTRFAWFAQDSIKLARRLTLNFGLRWQYDTHFISDPAVKRDPNVDRWIPGASTTLRFPKDCFSPSFGFAWSPGTSGKTVVRGGFYKAYDHILTFNDEAAMLPPGLGGGSYGMTLVAGPDGQPINIDGKHPTGNYSDLQGQVIRGVVPMIEQLHSAVIAAYRSFQFDPNAGASLFSLTGGTGAGAIVPGDQYKLPYSLQFNIGAQRQLGPNMVLSSDYVINRSVGMPAMAQDYERRFDAATLNATAAAARVKSVVGNSSMDEWIAANPGKNISAFTGLISDATFTGLTPDFARANFATGAFSRYRALQVSLRGRLASAAFLKEIGLSVSYALSRSESTFFTGDYVLTGAAENPSGSLDNHNWNSRELFGASNLDRTHILSVAATFKTPGGVRLSSLWAFQTAPPLILGLPNLAPGIGGTFAYLVTDLNGDGGSTTARGDLFPGFPIGALGRRIKSFADMNRVITEFNRTYAGQLTPHGKALVNAGLFTAAQLRTLGGVTAGVPLIPENNPTPWHNMLTADLRVERPIKLPWRRESMEVLPFADFYNLFNHAPSKVYGSGSGLSGLFGALNYDYANAPPGLKESDLTAARGRLNPTRKVMIGIRFNF